jgi:ribosomal-protein-serine acetyltransferase
MFFHPLSADSHLELLQKNHASDLFSVVNNNREHLRKWLPWVDANTTVRDTETFINLSLQGYSKKGMIQAGIFHKKKICWCVGFPHMDTVTRSASLGYWIAEKQQGQGLVASSVKALVNHGFGPLSLNRIEIHCAAENVRSQAIPKRLGFELEGVRRQAEWLYDHFVDHKSYFILAQNWAA